MNTKMKKNILYYAVALACGVVGTFFIYSCSSDDFYSEEMQMDKNGMVTSRALSSRMMDQGETLMDSIAASDEFWEFEMSSQLLAEKFDKYISTLSEEENDKLMENLNNDEYMEVIMKESNLENELQQMMIAKENLIQNTGFSRLSDDERIQLFTQFAESYKLTEVKLLKTREEGGKNSCLEQKEKTILEAKGRYDNAIVDCKLDGLVGLCALQAAARYNRDKDIAERRYKECIENNK